MVLQHLVAVKYLAHAIHMFNTAGLEKIDAVSFHCFKATKRLLSGIFPTTFLIMHVFTGADKEESFSSAGRIKRLDAEKTFGADCLNPESIRWGRTLSKYSTCSEDLLGSKRTHSGKKTGNIRKFISEEVLADSEEVLADIPTKKGGGWALRHPKFHFRYLLQASVKQQETFDYASKWTTGTTEGAVVDVNQAQCHPWIAQVYVHYVPRHLQLFGAWKYSTSLELVSTLSCSYKQPILCEKSNASVESDPAFSAGARTG